MNNYRVEEKLGEGSFGVVYKVAEVNTAAVYAMKVRATAEDQVLDADKFVLTIGILKCGTYKPDLSRIRVLPSLCCSLDRWLGSLGSVGRDESTSSTALGARCPL